DGRSPPNTTSIADPKNFTKSTLTRDRELPKLSSPETFYEVYRNARPKAAKVWKSRSLPRTTSISGPKTFRKSAPQHQIESSRRFREPERSENEEYRCPEQVYKVYSQRVIKSCRSLGWTLLFENDELGETRKVSQSLSPTRDVELPSFRRPQRSRKVLQNL
ncbi:hypothetical protein NPIL_220151, partial [Nephila pilipes]